nr:MAG TPA: hypothetical protein [Caudoviricetes sp.]
MNVITTFGMKYMKERTVLFMMKTAKLQTSNKLFTKLNAFITIN